MHQYQGLLREIMDFGYERTDRTGVGTIGIFGWQSKYQLAFGFPLVTTKKMFTKAIIVELLWFLKGDTNIKYLNDHGVKIWDEWADKHGDLGPIYGEAWRSWPASCKDPIPDPRETIDQIADVVESLRKNPDSRRHIVTAWNPATVGDCGLPPCHIMFQFNSRLVDGDRILDLQLYQRSADCFLGVPFNIASYALLLMMMAQVTGHYPGTFVHTYGDAHIYKNHLPQVREQLTRAPHVLPVMALNAQRTELDQFVLEDFKLSGYDPYPAIKGEVAV